MKSKTILITILLIPISLIFNQQKLNFSADTAESYVENNIKIKVFKNNVKIIDRDKILYTDLAKYFQDSNKVILNGSVKMHDKKDSLICNKLIIYKGDNERYEASGDIIFYKGNHVIKAQNLTYFITDTKIVASNDVLIEDNTRQIYGDNISINYINDLIATMNMDKNVKLFDSQTYFFKNNSNSQILEDKMESNGLYIKFDNQENIDFIQLDGMARADFNVINDSLLKGLNSVSGDTILLQFKNDSISNMNIRGGVIGSFKPDKKNKNLIYDISYNANIVDYNLLDEITLLTNNAKIFYGETILEGGEIKADLKKNMVESSIKNSIFPSVKTDNDPPTYGEHMEFDLVTETGNIRNGYNQIDMGIFRGDNFFTNQNEDIYIDNAIFTSCDNPNPHYYFASKKMKVDNRSSQIIAKPMVLYMQDLPTFLVPFAILPHSNKKRKSGFIMPSFGHSKISGTWIQDLGYYSAPNDYYDIITYLDFYDRSKVQIDSKLNYKKLYGDNWYNYKFSGFIHLKNYINELIPPNEDFTDLSTDATKKYSTIFEHTQDFSNNQYIRIKYEYYNFENLSDIIENDIDIRLDQQEISQLYYSRIWDYSTLTIGSSSNRDLALPNPEYDGEIRNYKQIEYPVITYRYNKPLLFGDGDKWYNSTKLTYNFSAYNKNITYSKESVWYTEGENNACTNGGTSISGNYDDCTNEEGNDSNASQGINTNNSNLVWSDIGITSEIKPSAENRISLNLPVSILSFNINPSLSVSEQWALSDVFNNNELDIIARKIKGSFSLNIQTNIYGVISANFLNTKIKTVRHVMTPSINTSYISKSKILKGEFVDFDQTFFQNGQNTTNNSMLISYLSLNNLFQAKILREDGIFFKRNIMSYNISTNYNWDTKLFNPLMSTISLKNISGGEYLRINVEQSLYEEESTALVEGFPRLTSISTSVSRTFGHELKGQNFNSSQKVDTSSNSQINQERDLWNATFGFTLTAKYDLINKWDLEYSTLSLNSNVNLSKEWMMNNKIYVDLVDMKINSHELEFSRSLHCWDFSFIMKTIGYNKGFGLKISISDPNLQSLKVTQSTMIRGNSW